MFRRTTIATLLGLTVSVTACGGGGSTTGTDSQAVNDPFNPESSIVTAEAGSPGAAGSDSGAGTGSSSTGGTSGSQGGNVIVQPKAEVKADPNESLLMSSTPRAISTKFFGVSSWDTPFKPNNIGAPEGSYGIARYCAYNASSENAATELTYLASGAASYTTFNTWVDYHRSRGSDLMVQVYMNKFGSATSLNQSQWNEVKAKYEEFLDKAAGRVKYVVLANEPLFAGTPGDNPGEATSHGWPSRSAPLYAQYVRVIKQITKARDNSIKVIGPEIMSLDSFRVSSAMAAMETSAEGPDVGYGNGANTKMKDWIDIFSFHAYYYTGGTFAPSDGGFSLINALKGELAKIGYKGPIWQTEYMRTYAGMYNDSWATIVEQIGRRHAAEVATGVGHSTNFEWGSYGPNSFFDDNSARGTTARNWWAAYVNWWKGSPIARIAQLKDGKIKVTREDGRTLLIPDNLTDGSLAPTPR